MENEKLGKNWSFKHKTLTNMELKRFLHIM